MAFLDMVGVPITVGDRVFKTGIDYGAPMWAHKGVVIGLAKVRVRVQWDQYLYDEVQPFHAVAPAILRVIPAGA